jgi:hypothetical protein
MNQKQALDTARRLVEQAVEIADTAGIEAADVVAPHCAEPTAQGSSGGGGEGRHGGDDPAPVWCGVPVVVDDRTTGLFEMPEPDEDPAQEPTFIATRSTADFVRQDFARYESALERMAERWREEKKRVMAEKTNRSGDE